MAFLFLIVGMCSIPKLGSDLKKSSLGRGWMFGCTDGIIWFCPCGALAQALGMLHRELHQRHDLAGVSTRRLAFTSFTWFIVCHCRVLCWPEVRGDVEEGEDRRTKCILIDHNGSSQFCFL